MFYLNGNWEKTIAAYLPLSVVRRVLRRLFQQRDVDQSAGQDKQHCHSVGSPAEWESQININNN